MIYGWKETARIKADPQPIGEELERIQCENNGLLKPQTIVQVARDKKNPLHSCFEWDDKKAAESYREDQARYILRHITVQVQEPEDEKPTEVRAYVNLVDSREKEREHVYTDIISAVSNDEWRSQIIGDVINRIQQLRHTLKTYDKVAQCFGTAQLKLSEIEDLITSEVA